MYVALFFFFSYRMWLVVIDMNNLYRVVVQLASLKPNMHGISVKVTVYDREAVVTSSEGTQVAVFTVGDETGLIYLRVLSCTLFFTFICCICLLVAFVVWVGRVLN
jgi:hypothetical protein